MMDFGKIAEAGAAVVDSSRTINEKLDYIIALLALQCTKLKLTGAEREFVESMLLTTADRIDPPL